VPRPAEGSGTLRIPMLFRGLRRFVHLVLRAASRRAQLMYACDDGHISMNMEMQSCAQFAGIITREVSSEFSPDHGPFCLAATRSQCCRHKSRLRRRHPASDRRIVLLDRKRNVWQSARRRPCLAVTSPRSAVPAARLRHTSRRPGRGRPPRGLPHL